MINKNIQTSSPTPEMLKTYFDPQADPESATEPVILDLWSTGHLNSISSSFRIVFLKQKPKQTLQAAPLKITSKYPSN